jgi:hypothetical protein
MKTCYSMSNIQPDIRFPELHRISGFRSFTGYPAKYFQYPAIGFPTRRYPSLFLIILTNLVGTDTDRRPPVASRVWEVVEVGLASAIARGLTRGRLEAGGQTHRPANWAGTAATCLFLLTYCCSLKILQLMLNSEVKKNDAASCESAPTSQHSAS